MKISIVDDDPKWVERIKNEVMRYDENKEMEIDVFLSGEEYLKKQAQYDISFIDIEMPGIDGFETISAARKYNPNGIYVILTTHVEMSRKGYVVNAFRYLDKTQLEEMRETIESAQVLLGRNEKIEVNVINDGVRKLTLKNIIYIETEKHYILIHTKHGVVKCSDRMQDVEKMLPDNWFNRCHHAYIVNLDEINDIKDKIIYLSNGDDIDVSDRKMGRFKKAYFNREYERANR
ncbi:MAG: response regulator transcription factor [Lachnospiraceae bacterium]|nr:response regulator transcription factor [Lachnospiraceae bacterium]